MSILAAAATTTISVPLFSSTTIITFLVGVVVGMIIKSKI